MRAQLLDQQPRLLALFDQVLEEDRLSHAYLFSGGFGSMALALYLAQSRFCEDLSAQKQPCGTCRPCRLIAQEEFADLTVIEPTGQLIKTEQIRSLIKDFSQSGFEGACQVFIIKDADRMHPNAANSLLKQIEEPNSPYYIFLLTADESRVLPTIRSRCQLFRLVADPAYLTKRLEDQGLLKGQAQVLSQLTDRMEELDALAGDKRVLDQLRQAQTLVDRLRRREDIIYLQVPALVALAGEKAEQERVFSLLLLLAAQNMISPRDLRVLEVLTEARRYWQANVSFQNALDFLVLTLEDERR